MERPLTCIAGRAFALSPRLANTYNKPMKAMDFRLRIPALVIVALVAASTAFGQDPPDPRAMWSRATLYRDEWGTPHVVAGDFRAMAFAFGYAQAADHIEGMLLAYRVANGRAAEVFGEFYAKSDEFSLKMAHARLAREALANVDPLTLDVCEGFALGVNTWIVEHRDQVPDWAEGVKPEDILALLHCYLMSYAPFDLADTYHRVPDSVSGNAWAIGPARSASGRAMLVINPHTQYGSPFQWYEAHLICQDMNIAGATLYGLPVILQGHNEVLGWALTPNQPDVADMYLESVAGSKRDPKSMDRRLLPDEERLLQAMLLSTTQFYHVITPAGLEQRGVPCAETPRGPVVGTLRGRLCSYQIGGYREFGTLSQLVAMARARSLGDFQGAMAMRQLPCFHVVYADQVGNIFYLYNATAHGKAAFDEAPSTLPTGEEAPPGRIDWTTPQPTGRPEFEWGPLIPIDALPQVTNPESGYLQACGTPPWLVTDDLQPNDKLPPWLVRDRDTFRARRARQLLGMGRRTFSDCQSMVYDVVVPFATDAVPQLLAIADARPDFVANAHPDLAGGLDVLRDWNHLALINSTGMTLFHAWWNAMRSLDPGAFPNDEALYAAFAANQPPLQDMAMRAAIEAVKMLRNEHGAITVPWGDVHTVTRGEREEALPGAFSGEPIFTASDFAYDNRKWRVTYGYGFAMAVEFGDEPAAVSMLPFGSSDLPGSPHFDDQLDLMAGRRFKVTRFSPDSVQRYAESALGCALHLRPAGVDAVFTLRALTPIQARLKVAADAPAALPEPLVPFTLFVETVKAPPETPIDIHMVFTIPREICAGADLPELAVYAYAPETGWAVLPEQEVNPDERTLTAFDQDGAHTYAVLGPTQYRVSRMEIPGADEPEPEEALPTPAEEVSLPVENAEPPAPSASAVTGGLSLEEADQPAPGGGRVFWGVPPRRESKPIAIPEEKPIDGDALPRLDFIEPPGPGDGWMEPGAADQGAPEGPKAAKRAAKRAEKEARQREKEAQSSGSATRNFTWKSKQETGSAKR